MIRLLSFMRYSMDVKRKCIACHKTVDRGNLIKITKDFKTNEIILRPSKNDFGRSIYICKDSKCVEDALKKDRLSKTLKKKLSETEKENIKTVLNAMLVIKH